MRLPVCCADGGQLASFHGSKGPDPGYGVVAKFVEVSAVTDCEVKADGASFPLIPAAGDLLHGMFVLTPVEPDRSDPVARPEDGGDPDMFPPTITSASILAGTLTVSGTHNGGTAGTTIRFEFFSNSAC